MVRGVQVPRVRSVPAAAGSRGGEVVEVAATAGLGLHPFQALVLEDACGVRADGRWAAFEVGVSLARQNGKGGIIEARELAGVFAFGERLQVHSAHEFQTATEAMLRMEELLAGTPEFAKEVKSVSRSHGAEGFVFRSGQRLRYRTRTKGGGRGFTADTLYLDEAMILQEPFIGALLPTLSGRSVTGNPQVWYTGSAVDRLVHEHGLVFARLRARGLAGDDPKLAFFEWSAVAALDADGEPVTPDSLSAEALLDREGWAAANPGLGVRIAEEFVEDEARSMLPRTFAVERLGVGDWPSELDETVEPVIAVEVWQQTTDRTAVLADPVAFAFDVAPDRATSAIAAAGLSTLGRPMVEVVEHRRGTGWVVEWLVERIRTHDPLVVACEGVGAAASLLLELEQAGVEVLTMSAADHAKAAGGFFDDVTERRLVHLDQLPLDLAVAGATQRPLGGAWAWNRRSSATDISPLVACTLALGAYRIKIAEKPKARPRVFNLASLEETSVAAG